MLREKEFTFETTIKYTDYVVSHHRVHGVCIMPGVTFLDMIYRALIQEGYDPATLELRQLLFKEPIAATEAYDKKLQISLQWVHSKGIITATSQKVKDGAVLDSKWDDNFSCELLLEKETRTHQEEIDKIKEVAKEIVDMDEAYAFARRIDIFHGEFMKGLGKIYKGDSFVMAEIHLSELAGGFLKYSHLHPVYLDSATLVPGLLWENHLSLSDNEPTPYIPLYIEAFSATDRLTDKCYVYVQQQDISVSSNQDVMYSDVAIFNAAGQSVAVMKRLTGKRVRSRELIKNLEQVGQVRDKNNEHLPITEAVCPTPQIDAGLTIETVIQQDLCKMVAGIKGKTWEEISVDTGYYDQGLDSRDLLKLVQTLEQKLGIQLYPTLLFEYSNIADLAKYFAAEYGEIWSQTKQVDSQSATFTTQVKGSVDQQAGADNESGLPNNRMYFYREWVQENLDKTAGTGVFDHKVLIFDDGNEVYNALVKDQSEHENERVILVQRGTVFRAVNKSIYEVNPQREGDFSLLCEELKNRKLLPDTVFHLWANEVFDHGRRSIENQLRDSFYPLLFLLRNLFGNGPGRKVKIICGYEYKEAGQQPLFASLSGFLRALQLEAPGFSGKTVALPEKLTAQQIVDILTQEVSCFDGQVEVLYEGLTRMVRQLVQISPGRFDQEVSIRNKGVYLITGGLGGLGKLFGRLLAEKHQATVILTGLAELTAELEDSLVELSSSRGQIHYRRCDVTNERETRKVINEILDQHGQLNGIVHCAGVLRDSLVWNKTIQEAKEVLAPKLFGTINLDLATKSSPLDFFVLFSSASAVMGNVGQSDYAFANSFMDNYAELRERLCQSQQRSGFTVSINWPLWHDGGMAIDGQVALLMKNRTGLEPLTAKSGITAFYDIFKLGKSGVLVTEGNEYKIRQTLGVADKPANPVESLTQRNERQGFGGDIAIIGVSGRYPGANNLEEYWQVLREGRDCITEIPRERWDYTRYFDPDPQKEGKVYSKWGGFIKDADKFDSLFFNISPREAQLMDPQERLFLETVWETLEDAGYTRTCLGKTKTGVFVGAMWSDYQLFGAEATLQGNPVVSGSSHASIANRVSYCFDFRGPSMAVDTMCSSSLTAIHLACESLRKGECEAAIAGGVNLSLHPSKYLFLSQAKFASTDGKCRSFGADGDGYVPGEGVGAVLLKPLANAVRDGDQIYAVIKGSAVNHGGKTSGYSVPNPGSQAEVIREALHSAGISPRSISYIEAHGTGTSLGDPIEIAGLVKAFSEFTPEKQFCSIGSVKSNIGHLEAAAGIAAVTKVLLQMKYGMLAPSIHAAVLNPNIDFPSTPFYVQQGLSHWNSPHSLRRAGISSFGAGGANVHIILEEYLVNVEQSEGINRPRLIVLSAKDEERLKNYAQHLGEFIRSSNFAGKGAVHLVDLPKADHSMLREIRKRIVELAAQTLGVDETHISLTDKIADSGFEPVNYTELVTMLSEDYNLDCTGVIYSEEYTLEALAHTIDKLLTESTPEENRTSESSASRACSRQPLALADIEYTLQIGREALDQRLAFVAASPEEVVEKLELFVKGVSGSGVYHGNIRHNKERFNNLLSGQAGANFVQEILVNGDLDKLAQLWVSGVKFDWTSLHKMRDGRRISLPTYPFAKERHWIPVSLEKKLQAIWDGVEPSQLMHFTQRWEREALERKDSGSMGVLLVFDEGEANCNVLADKFRTMGTDTPLYRVKKGKSFSQLDQSTFEINPVSKDDYLALFKTIKGLTSLPLDIVCFSSSKQTVFNSKVLTSQLKTSFYSILYLTQALMEQRVADRVRLLYLYSCLDNDISQPAFEALSGLGKTIMLEQPNYHYKVIGLKGQVGDLASILIDELNTALDYGSNILYHNDQRLVCKNTRVEGPALYNRSGFPRASFKEKGVYLITGGAGGLGLVFSRYLAQKYQARLVLAGRSELNIELRQKIDDLIAMGGEVVYVQSDVSHKKDVQHLVKTAKAEYGEINGVIHSAGVLHDSFILTKSREAAERVLAPKVYGTLHLDELTKGEPLDLFMLFSSTVAITGNVGQSDYAYANRFMDRYGVLREVLRQRGERSGQTVVINWPLWDEGGMQISREDRRFIFDKTGLEALPTELGLRAFEELLASAQAQAIVVYGNREKLEQMLLETDRMYDSEISQPVDLSPAELLTRTEDTLKEVFSSILQVPKDKIDSWAGFQEYGIDSVTIKEFNMQIEEKLGPLSKTLLFEYQTIGDLAQYLVQNHSEKLGNLLGLQSGSRQALKQQVMGNRAFLPGPRQGQEVSRDIAIIGISGRYPMAPDLEAFWHNLKSGTDCITEIPPDRWDKDKYFEPEFEKLKDGKMYCKWGGFLEEADRFDPLFFNISPKEAEAMDPQERLFLETAWSTLEDAGYTRDWFQDATVKHLAAQVGVFVGITSNTYQLVGAEEWSKGNYVTANSLPWSIANRVSYLFNFQGPSMPVDTACSSSLTAIHLACESLIKGECTAALAGGVNLYLHPAKYIAMCQMRMLSPTGKCHTFGEHSDGFVPGEGVGAVLLKTLEQAEADGDHIYAVIKGSSVNHGGTTHGYTVPNPNAQADLIKRALERAGMDPRTITYIEAHGTGTKLGDPVEITGLTKAFREFTQDKGFCSIGSVKSNIGHLESAAGIAGITKVILQMRNRQLVPSLNCTEVNHNIDFSDSPFFIQDSLTEWRQPRRAGISSFGAGGSNAHVVLEEYVPDRQVRREEEIKPYVMVLSARDERALNVYVDRVLAYLDKLDKDSSFLSESNSMTDMAFTLQTGREPMEHRLAVLATSVEEFANQLKQFKLGIAQTDRVFTGVVPASRVRAGKKVAEKSGEMTGQGKEADELARLWVSGQAVDWNALYSMPLPRRVPLPTYPFSREYFWINRASGSLGSAVNRTSLHPLIHSNESSLTEQKYATHLAGTEFFLIDHVVAGQKVFPGAAYLEMARAAGTLAGEAAVTGLKNVVWSVPLAITGNAKEVIVSLYPQGETVAFEVATGSDGDRCIHGQGLLQYDAPQESEVVFDLASIRERCSKIVAKHQLYTNFKEAGLEYGNTFQSIERLYMGDGEALSELELPSGIREETGEFKLHPSLIDGAFQTVIGAREQGTEWAGEVFVPFALERIEIYRFLPQRCFAYCNSKTSGAANVHKFDIWLLDEQGQPLAALISFSLRTLRKMQHQPEVDEPEVSTELLYCLSEWQQTDITVPDQQEKIAGDILLFDTQPEMAAAWRKRLDETGNSQSRLVVVNPGQDYSALADRTFSINPERTEDYSRLLEQLTEQGFSPGSIVYLWTRDGSAWYPDKVEEQLKFSLYPLFNLTKALMRRKVVERTSLLYFYPEEKGRVEPIYAAMSGFARTVRLENPRLMFKTVGLDMKDISTMSSLAFAELLGSADSDIDIKYEKDRRYTRKITECIPSNTAMESWQPDGAYLITGAAGGLGKIFARFLAEKAKVKLVLVDQLPLNDTLKEHLCQLHELGAEAAYFEADLSERGRVQELFKQLKADYGELKGVIHAAGVIRDALIKDKGLEDVRTVLQSKIYGTVNLDEVTAGEPLEFFVVFSSLASVWGNLGQSDYAFGNSFLNSFAEFREGLRLAGERQGITRALCWPLWKDGGMGVNEAVAAMMSRSTGVRPLLTEAGLKAFEDCINTDSPSVVVLYGNDHKMRNFITDGYRDQYGTKGSVAELEEQDRQSLISLTEEFLKEVLAREIKLPAYRINTKDPLEKYGIDSVMIVNLTNELENIFGELSKTLFFEFQTISELAGYFAENHTAVLLTVTGLENRESRPNSEPGTKSNTGQVRNRFMAVGKPRLLTALGENEIAIIGVSGRYPMARNLDEYWENLKQGKDCITEIPEDRWDYRQYYDSHRGKPGKTNSKWGGFIDEVDCFDPLFFNISPREAEILDPQERIFLETAWHTLEDAGYTRNRLAKAKVGVFVGVMYGEYQLFGAEETQKGHVIALGSSYASIANRVSYQMNFQGPSMAVDTMCSSSLTAIHLACESIRRGECDTAIAGGVNVSIHPNKYIFLSQGQFAASDGRCRTFGAGGDGYVPGEGVGAVMLKPLSRAIADGDRVYAVIKGSALNHGGKTNGYTVPNPNAQGELIIETCQKAGVEPRSISYIEAHGTGTSLGDPIEITGLVKAFKGSTQDRSFCSIGSVKSNIGHLESAAGIAGLTKVLLQMQYKQLVPSINSEPPNPNIDFDKTPFYVQKQLTQWEKLSWVDKGQRKFWPRRAGVSSFGAGGANAHIILEEYEPPQNSFAPEPVDKCVILLSAKSEEQLKAYASETMACLEKYNSTGLASKEEAIILRNIAFTLQVGREAQEERLALVVKSIEEAVRSLKQFCYSDETMPGLFRNRTKAGNENAGYLISGKAGAEFVRIVLEDREYEKLAQIWVAGGEIDWTLLYGNPKPIPLSLPKYPFARERYWVNIKDGTSVGHTLPGSGVNYLHPLVGFNSSSFWRQRFTTPFSGDEMFFKDHVIFGQKLLPGAACLEMARVASELAGEQQIAALKNIVWVRPVSVQEDILNVHIDLNWNEELVEFVVLTEGLDGEKIVHAQGKADYSAEEGNPDLEIDIAAVRSRCPGIIEKQELYKTFSDAGFEYSGTFQTIETLFCGEEEVLGVLELPTPGKTNFGDFGLHPALVDGAFQTVIGLIDNSQTREYTYLPFAVGEVKILETIPDKCYVYTTPSLQQSSDPLIKKFDIHITNLDGRGIILIREFSVRGLPVTARPEPTRQEDKEIIDIFRKLQDGQLDEKQVEKMLEVMMEETAHGE